MSERSQTEQFRSASGFVVPTIGQWFGLDLLDQQLFTQLAEITSTFAQSAARIWGFGFRPELRPTLLVRQVADHSYGYALNIDDVAALGNTALGNTALGNTALGNAVQLVPLPEHLGLPPVYRFGPELVAELGLTAQEPAQFAVDIAGQECLALSFDCDEAHASSWEFARFFVHEAFHQYQMFEMAWRVPTGYDPSVPWMHDPTDAEMSTRETWFLEAAAAQNTCPTKIGGAAELVASFVGLRAERHSRRPDLVSLEQGHEQVEGSARFVENNYASLNGRELRLPIPSGNDLDPEEFASIGRYYRTGARVMELLDRTQVPWRHRLAKGHDPVSILIDVLAGQALPVAPRFAIGVTSNLSKQIDLRDPVAQPACGLAEDLVGEESVSGAAA